MSHPAARSTKLMISATARASCSLNRVIQRAVTSWSRSPLANTSAVLLSAVRSCYDFAVHIPYSPSVSSGSVLLRTGALRGRFDSFLAVLAAGRMARLTLAPFVLGFFAACFRAAPLVFLLRSLNSSSSGSPSLLSADSSSEDAPSASTPLSLSSPRLRLLLATASVAGANLSGFFETRPDFRRAVDEAASLAGELATAALMVFARCFRPCEMCCGWLRGGATMAVDMPKAGMVR